MPRSGLGGGGAWRRGCAPGPTAVRRSGVPGCGRPLWRRTVGARIHARARTGVADDRPGARDFGCDDLLRHRVTGRTMAQISSPRGCRMANDLTGDYDVVTQFSLGAVNRILAAMHRGKRLPHSLSMAVDDLPNFRLGTIAVSVVDKFGEAVADPARVKQ